MTRRPRTRPVVVSGVGGVAALVTLVTLVTMMLPPAATRVFAWGAQGHHVVARVAWTLMTPAARDAVTTLLGGGMTAFVASATWADEIRSARPETANWHFVDIPADVSRYEAGRDCRPTDKGDCIIAEIARARAEIVDPARPAGLRAESLKFLVHFVGDIHQPLHDVDDHDRGGNDVHVTALRSEAGRATNLHAAWDTGLINLEDELGGETEAGRASRLAEDVKAHPPDVAFSVVRWAEEGHDLAVRVAYHYPAFSPAGPPAAPITLDSAYRTAAAATIDRQLAVGGARLAALLNALFGSR